jgi:PAS domain-containing protein
LIPLIGRHSPLLAFVLPIALGRYFAAREEQANTDELIENLSEGIYRSLPDGRQIKANKALVRLNGYSSKEELIANAVETIKSPLDMDLPNTSVREDLLTIAKNIKKDFSDREQTILACVALELRTNPEFRRIHEEIHERRRALVRKVVRAGIERGELRGDLGRAGHSLT